MKVDLQGCCPSRQSAGVGSALDEDGGVARPSEETCSGIGCYSCRAIVVDHK